MKIVFGELNTRFPQVGFVQCWMNPIMRKTKMPPDPFMRKQLYSLLKPADMFTKQVNVIGNNLALRKSSELYNILEKTDLILRIYVPAVISGNMRPWPHQSSIW